MTLPCHMSQMPVASTEMLVELPSTFPNFSGYFLLGKAHHFFCKYMGKSKHPILNTEKLVHPTAIACKWWDTDHQLVAAHQVCHAMSAATRLDFNLSNIINFDDVMTVLAGVKRKSEERLDAGIRRLEGEKVVEAAKSKERLDAAIHRLEGVGEMKEVAAAAAAQLKAMKEAAAVAVAVAVAVVVTVAAGVSVVVAAAVKRKAFVENAGSQPSCVWLCIVQPRGMQQVSHL